jgi:hypothetical protein
MLCQYRVTTSIGRTIDTPPDRLLSEPPGQVSSNAAGIAAGYPLALQYPDYWMYQGETIISSVAFGCRGIDLDQPCDCINGGCLPKTTYGTPGKYATLAACQSGCAKDSTCTGECIDPAEIAALRQAANQLQTKFCG